MPAETVNIDDIDVQMGAMRRLREGLQTEAVGLTIVDADPGWEGPEHDHGESDHEEVYLLLDGDASVTIDGETVDLEPGDAVRIDPDETRQVHNGDTASRFVFAGANLTSDL